MFPERWLALIPSEKRGLLYAVLADDPRPAYQDDPARVYGFAFSDFDVRFTVEAGRLTVTEVVRLREQP